jgi:two-component system, chemotaxis family, chemotaxis protein CheY
MATCLVTDDSMFQRYVLGNLAREEGYEVLEAKTGRQCLEIARTHRPEVMLLDLNMPEGNGLDVLETLKKEALEIQVIIISADIQETTRARCLGLGVVDVINKPVKEEMLRQKLKEVFPRARAG